MKLSVVIVSFNVRSRLEQCLDALEKAADGIAHEVIVVDNHSDDDSLDWLRRQSKAWRIIVNTQNLGFAAAANQGADAATGTWLLMLNPDTLLEPQALRRLLEMGEADQNRQCLGPRVESFDGHLVSVCRQPPLGLFRAVMDLFPWRAIRDRFPWLWPRPYASSAPVSAIQGSCMLLRRNVFEQLGGFDDRVPLYLDDRDLCQRIWQSGGQVFYVADAVVLHCGGESVKTLKHPMMTTLMRLVATDLMFQKQKRPLARFIHRASFGLFASCFCLVDGLLWLPLALLGRGEWVRGYIHQHWSMLNLAVRGQFHCSSLPQHWPRRFIDHGASASG